MHREVGLIELETWNLFNTSSSWGSSELDGRCPVQAPLRLKNGFWKQHETKHPWWFHPDCVRDCQHWLGMSGVVKGFSHVQRCWMHPFWTVFTVHPGIASAYQGTSCGFFVQAHVVCLSTSNMTKMQCFSWEDFPTTVQSLNSHLSEGLITESLLSLVPWWKWPETLVAKKKFFSCIFLKGFHTCLHPRRYRFVVQWNRSFLESC